MNAPLPTSGSPETLDLSPYDRDGLLALAGAVTKELAARRKVGLRALQAQIRTLVAEAEYSLAEVLAPMLPVAGESATALPCYRHPINEDQAWLGRGRKPQWVLEWLSNGGTLDDLRVS